MNPEVTIIGAGRLGGALAIALSNNRFPVVNLVARRLQSARALAAKIETRPNAFDASQISEINFTELVLIATPDSEIAVTAAELAASFGLKQKSSVILHTSGSLSSDVLSDLKSINVRVGSLHPLVSVSDSETGALKFANAYFCIEGDHEAVVAAENIVAALCGHSFAIAPENKALYHAAAVLSAGHLIALFDLAAETLCDCGLERAAANRVLLPLAASAISNLNEHTPAHALTGTFARADLDTMKKHLSSLHGKPAEAIYRELGKRSLKLAAEQGADAEKLGEMKSLLLAKD